MTTSVAKGTAGPPAVEEGGSIIASGLLYIFAAIAVIWFVRRGKCHMESSEMPRLPMPGRVAFVLFFGSFALGSVGLFIGMSQGEPESMEQLAWMSVCALVAQLPVVITYCMFSKFQKLSRSVGIAAVAILVFAPLAWTTAGISHTVFAGLEWEDPSGMGHETLQQLTVTQFSTASLIVILTATIGAGIVEEIVFRGILLPSIPLLFRGISLWGAVLLTSAAFALMHLGTVPPSALIGLAALSVGLCWARIKSGGIVAPILVHMLFNTLNIVLIL